MVEVKSTFCVAKPKPFPGYTYTYEQAVAANVWIVPHNLGRKPAAITVVDSADSVVGCDKEYYDENTVILKFKYPFKGKAYIN